MDDQKNSPNARKHQRFEVEKQIRLLILIPEDTLRSSTLDGVTQDISVGGIKLRVHDLPMPIYKKLILKTRDAIVRFIATEEHGQDEVLGRLLWYAYEKKEVNSSSAACMIGVQVNSEQEEGKEAYLALLKQVEHR